ncbi:MAG: hypothetical protein HY646_17715 [Acidobacteria bacterium]|nr:hypothetical protein [Acidobacteriota bacterium]
MESVQLGARHSQSLDVDLCTNCQVFWFDKYESLKLTPASTLKLMKYIGEHTASGKPTISGDLKCPRCSARILFTNDLQRNTRFTYWRCPQDHGRFITFFQFLREKNFVRQLTLREIQELRENVQNVNCSNCGAPIDLNATTDCKHCGSPLSILDMKQPQQMLEQLRKAAEPKEIDPTLPLDLLRAKRDVETAFRPLDSGDRWWNDVSSYGLVQAGLGAVARWLNKMQEG